MLLPDTYGQFLRFSVVGLASNLVLYLLYLVLTSLGVTPKIAMSILYLGGVLQTFLFNKRWTFQYIGMAQSALVRYALSYLCGYIVNLVALYMLVDKLMLPHQVVQGCMIIFLACMLFLLQKFWVFK